MRKLFLSLVALITMTVAVNAQVASGSVFLGANLGLTSTSFEGNDDLSETSFVLLPDVGFFVSDKVAVGLGIGYRQDQTTVDGVNSVTGNATISKNTISEFVIAPFARYYVSLGGSDNWYFFGQLRPQFGFGNASLEITEGNTSVETDGSSSSIDVSVSPGFAFFPSEKWAIEVNMRGFYYNVIDPDTDAENDSTTEIGLGLNFFAPNVGVRVFF